jgi:hypothetical protein
VSSKRLMMGPYGSAMDGRNTLPNKVCSGTGEQHFTLGIVKVGSQGPLFLFLGFDWQARKLK